jgi:SPOR domain/PilZ domain
MSKKAEQSMERRRQPRTPVNINALLIGEKTVPRGCRVINVSQQGMLLYCEADGRLSTFNDGDIVDIHLTVMHQGEQKKLTIPSYVRHVADNSVDVEFHHPDPILMEMIEAYRVSDQHRLEATLGHNHSVPEAPPRVGSTVSTPPLQGAPAVQTRSSAFRPFYLGLLGLLFTLCVAAGGYLYTASIDHRISTLESLSRKQASELKELQNHMFSATLQEGRYASLNARITALGDAFAHLEDKLALLLPAIGTAATGKPAPSARTGTPAAARPAIVPVVAEPARSASGLAGQPAKMPARPVPPRQPEHGPTASGSPPATTERQAATSAAPAPAVTGTANGQIRAPGAARPAETASKGPWTINLLSSANKSDVDRLADLAAKAGIQTTTARAEVKGRNYWRLQVTGFPSLGEAKRNAEPVRKALGIDEVWIFKKQ